MKYNSALNVAHNPAIISAMYPWLGLAALLICSTSGVASSKSGVDSAIGNRLSQSASYPVEKLSTFRTLPTRTPTGLMYTNPVKVEAAKSNAWTGSIEVGTLFNDGEDDAAQFREYTDWDEGAVLNNLLLMGDFDSTYFKLKGGAIGNNDQFLKVEYGRYGSYRFNAFYTETQHIFANDATLLYQGIGTDVLTLPAPLVAGGNTSADLANALTSAGKGTVGLERDKWGGALHLFALGHWQVKAKYSLEERDGIRPSGGSFYPDTIGGVVENLEPIDYKTHDMSLDAYYAGEKTFVNLGLKASIFKNDNSSLTWDNAFDIVQSGGPQPRQVIEQGRAALPPDNEFYQLEAEFARLLPMGGQLTAYASWSRMEQDEDLLPPTITSTFVSGVDTNDWNTTAALSQLSADAKIESLAGGIELRLSPWRKASLGLSLDYFDEDDDTSYTAFNPQTGEYGYIAQDSPRINRRFNGGNRVVHYKSIPFNKTKRSGTFDISYRPFTKTTLGLEWRETRYDYDVREVEESDETRVKVYLSTRKLDWATIRLSYLSENRNVDYYESNPYDEYYTTSLPDFVPPGSGVSAFTLDEMRKHDIADRDLDKYVARVNFLIRDDMGLMVSAQHEDQDYGGDYGLLGRETTTINMEWNYQASATLNTFIFLSNQWVEGEMANIEDDVASPDSSAGGVTYPLSGRWSEESDETSVQVGVGISYTGQGFGFEASFTSIDSETSIDYDSVSSGSGEFSDISFKSRLFESNFTWNSVQDWQFRLYYRYERGEIRDWALTDLSALEGNNLFIQATPEDYSVNTVGLFVTYQLR